MRRLLLCLFLLPGCAGLAPALQTAHEAAKIACSLLQGSSPVDVLAATMEMQKAVTAALRDAAAERADPETARALFASIAHTAGALEGLSEQLARLAGEKATRGVVPCPVGTAVSP